MRFERAVLFACLCLCAACNSGGGFTLTCLTTCGGAPSGPAVTLTVDGAAVDLSAVTRAQQTTAPYLTSISASNADSTTSLTLELGAYPPGAGTYSCPAIGVAILYSTNGAAFYSGVNSAALTDPTPTSCTITVTNYSPYAPWFQGTFSATVAGGGNAAGTTHVITNGSFYIWPGP